VIHAAVICVLLLVGIRLSAFFSGSETGYYRLSLPRIMIDAQAGDATARQLLWFARRPANFMATALIGNNLANYLITCAVGMAVSRAVSGDSMLMEVGATAGISPLVFLLGELLPKSVYYRAPLAFMRRDVKWLRVWYAIFWLASWPLVAMTKLLERFRSDNGPALNMLLGRDRLALVMSHGRHEGVLTDVQTRLASGLLQIASQPIKRSMTPLDRVLAVDESASLEEMLAFARRYGLSSIIIRCGDASFVYVKAADLALRIRGRESSRQPIPLINHDMQLLDAFEVLRAGDALHGAVVDDADRVIGFVSRRGLAERFFRAADGGGPQPPGHAHAPMDS